MSNQLPEQFSVDWLIQRQELLNDIVQWKAYIRHLRRTGQLIPADQRPFILQHPAIRGVYINKCILCNDKAPFGADNKKQYAHAHSLPQTNKSYFEYFKVEPPEWYNFICFSNEENYRDPVTQLHELAHILHHRLDTEPMHGNRWKSIFRKLAKQYNMVKPVEREIAFYDSSVSVDQQHVPDWFYTDLVDGKLKDKLNNKEVVFSIQDGKYQFEYASAIKIRKLTQLFTYIYFNVLFFIYGAFSYMAGTLAFTWLQIVSKYHIILPNALIRSSIGGVIVFTAYLFLIILDRLGVSLYDKIHKIAGSVRIRRSQLPEGGGSGKMQCNMLPQG